MTERETTVTTSRITSATSSQTMEPSTTRGSPCMNLNVPDCAGVPYTQTTTPNLIGHSTFEEALIDFERQYSGLLSIRCSSFVREFVCSVYFPPCTATYSMFDSLFFITYDAFILPIPIQTKCLISAKSYGVHIRVRNRIGIGIGQCAHSLKAEQK